MDSESLASLRHALEADIPTMRRHRRRRRRRRPSFGIYLDADDGAGAESDDEGDAAAEIPTMHKCSDLTFSQLHTVPPQSRIVMLHSETCGHCLEFAPHFDALASVFPEVEFAKVNVNASNVSDAPDFVQAELQTVPTLLVQTQSGGTYKYEGPRAPQPLAATAMFAMAKSQASSH